MSTQFVYTNPIHLDYANLILKHKDKTAYE